ncbi:MAG: sortase [Chloroflexota bacterium]
MILGGIRALFTRLIPALLTALGVVIVTAGMLSSADPASAGVMPSPSASVDPSGPAPSFSVPIPSASPAGSPGSSAAPSPSGGPAAVATRIVIPALRIDLPVVAGPSGYPYCNVAMWYSDQAFGQPGEGKPVYLFAHARDGMFGPIYNLVMQQGTPNKLVNDLVQVYTSDNRLHQYVITNVYPHQLNMDRATSSTGELLWLQTSEGAHGTPGKTQVLAKPLTVGDADPKDAHPTPHPVNCAGT